MAQRDTRFPSLMNLWHSIVTGGTFIQNNYNHNGERPGYTRLLENVATAALPDSVDVVDPPKCHPNTRVAIIQCIIDWAVGLDQELRGKHILWLKGAAGSGKSAIARSVAEQCAGKGLLLGAFFFGAADPTRNHVGKLVATLSYQISLILPEFRDMVAAFIEDDPLIFGRSIRTQFSTLIIRPLSVALANRPTASTATPCLIIIDGLDECSSIDSQRDLLFALQETTTTTSFIRFLICGRPESHLNSAFRSSSVVPILHNIFLDDLNYSADEDIQVYLEDKFKQIKEEHVFKNALPDPWPAPGIVDDLVDKASGQFIYAATAIRYVESPRHRPDQRLNVIFHLRPPFKDLPFTELDALYRLIISKAEDPSIALDILAFLALYGWSETVDIEAILQLERGTVEVLLADLHSIVRVSRYSVGYLHKSLGDFLAEPQRAGELYRDLSRAQLSHIAVLISIFSTPRGQLMSCNRNTPISRVWDKFQKPDSMKADYVSSDIVKASQQFHIFEFFKTLHTYSLTDWQKELIPSRKCDLDFIILYFLYLHCIKDVSKSTRLMYWKQIRQYCECVLEVLDDIWSDDWMTHFVFAYCHLLNDPRHRLPLKLSYALFRYKFRRMGLSSLGITILHVTAFWGMVPVYLYPADIAKISHALIEDAQKEVIFAKSASFCLALLCDERRASQDAGRFVYAIPRLGQRKKREHPWHWRQIVPKPPSLGRRLALIGLYRNYKFKLMKVRRALRNGIPYGYNDDRLLTPREYSQVKSEPEPKPWQKGMKDEVPQQWRLYLFLLDLLPHILPLAARYEPLVDMCRKKCLSSLSQVWPKKSRRVRQAINSYLRRMDSEEGSK
ncbi:hypothetical protein D9613_012798 [Agrocybe pediades]|uniref:Nephrocystin 3-like N-terminal domain-containing protein n=1 Tax=Agrocybe pediades TaxID=84607 RepID=A0A8H4R1T8_9AGAR|nr:hypothetical protein D9613_012798 [Agrocybe pediades]